MRDAYRDAPIQCPGCSQIMDPRPIEGAIVDVCPVCAGLWVDWFDGDMAVVAEQSGARHDGGSAPPAGSAGGCPRCRAPLEVEAYSGEACEIRRCGQCAGAFVPRSSLDALLALGPGRDEEDASEPSAFSRLVTALRRWLAGNNS